MENSLSEAYGTAYVKNDGYRTYIIEETNYVFP